MPNVEFISRNRVGRSENDMTVIISLHMGSVLH